MLSGTGKWFASHSQERSSPGALSSISAGGQPCQDHFIGSSNIGLLSISRQHVPRTLSVPQFLQMRSKALPDQHF